MATALPESVQEIAEVIGEDRALYLVRKLPQCGKRSWRRVLYVPKSLNANHPLVEILGWPDARKMVRHFGGEILQPANCNGLARADKCRRVHRLRNQGLSPKEIAKAESMTLRNVYYILKEKPPEDTQP